MQLNHEALEQNLKMVEKEMVSLVEQADPFQGAMTGEKLRQILNSPLSTDIKKNTLMTITMEMVKEQVLQEELQLQQLIQHWIQLGKAHAHARHDAGLPPREIIEPDQPVVMSTEQALSELAEMTQEAQDARVYGEMSAVFSEFKEELGSFYQKADQVLQEESEKTFEALLQGDLRDDKGEPVPIELREDLFTQDEAGNRVPTQAFLDEKAERQQRHQATVSVYEHHAKVMKVLNSQPNENPNEPPAPPVPPPAPAVAAQKLTVLKSIDLLADLQAMRKPNEAAFAEIEKFRQDQFHAVQKGETLHQTLSERINDNGAILSDQLGKAVRAVVDNSNGLKQVDMVNKLVVQAAEKGLDHVNKDEFRASIQHATENLTSPELNNRQQAEAKLGNLPVAANFKPSSARPRPSSPQPGRQGGWAGSKPSQGLDFDVAKESIQQQKQAAIDPQQSKPADPEDKPTLGM